MTHYFDVKIKFGPIFYQIGEWTPELYCIDYDFSGFTKGTATLTSTGEFDQPTIAFRYSTIYAALLVHKKFTLCLHEKKKTKKHFLSLKGASPPVAEASLSLDTIACGPQCYRFGLGPIALAATIEMAQVCPEFAVRIVDPLRQGTVFSIRNPPGDCSRLSCETVGKQHQIDFTFRVDRTMDELATLELEVENKSAGVHASVPVMYRYAPCAGGAQHHQQQRVELGNGVWFWIERMNGPMYCQMRDGACGPFGVETGDALSGFPLPSHRAADSNIKIITPYDTITALVVPPKQVVVDVSLPLPPQSPTSPQFQQQQQQRIGVPKLKRCLRY